MFCGKYLQITFYKSKR